MYIFLFRIALTFFVLVFLYQPHPWARGLGLVLGFVCMGLSRVRVGDGPRYQILNLLADKVFFGSVLIVLVDLKVLWVPFVAWVVGVVFIHSGVDLLQKSLHASDLNFRSLQKINAIHMILAWLAMTIFVMDDCLPKEWVSHVLVFVSYVWFFLTVFFLAKSLVSANFRKLMNNA